MLIRYRSQMSARTPDLTISVFSQRGLDRRHADDISEWFQRFAGPIRLITISKPIDVPTDDTGRIACASALECLAHLRTEHLIPDEQFLFLLTATPNDHNLFSHADPEMRAGFGHIEDFRWLTSAPASVVATRYIFELIFTHLLFQGHVAPSDAFHMVARGCLFDYCPNKSDLSLSLRTADICGDCMEKLRQVGVPDSLLQQTIEIMEGTRPQALNTGQYLPAEERHSRWPFPVAITRHKAVQAVDHAFRFNLLIDHFDSLIRYFFVAKEVDVGHKPSIKERPSLGDWVDALARSLAGEKRFRNVISIINDEKIVNLRNEKRGHGWMAAHSEAYAADAQRLEEILDRIEHELRPFFFEHNLVVVRRISLRDGKYVVEGSRLLGSHILHPLLALELENEPRQHGLTGENRVFLADSHMQSFKEISPYIQETTCPECHHRRVLITDGGNTFIDALVGHRVQLPEGVPLPTHIPQG